MRERACIEVDTHHMCPGNVFVDVNAVAQSEIGVQGVFEVVEAIEEASVVSQVVIHAAKEFVIPEGHGKPSIERSVKRRGDLHGRERILLDALAVSEEEQFVLDDRATQAAPIL